MIEQTWIKTTKVQKQQWLLAEEGSYEDSNRSRDHAYVIIRGSYWASMYVDAKALPVVVKSFVSSTFQEQSPKHWSKLAPQVIEVCEKFERPDLVALIKEAQATV
jgi:hypothetical protein